MARDDYGENLTVLSDIVMFVQYDFKIYLYRWTLLMDLKHVKPPWDKSINFLVMELINYREENKSLVYNVICYLRQFNIVNIVVTSRTVWFLNAVLHLTVRIRFYHVKNIYKHEFSFH